MSRGVCPAVDLKLGCWVFPSTSRNGSSRMWKQLGGGASCLEKMRPPL